MDIQRAQQAIASFKEERIDFVFLGSDYPILSKVRFFFDSKKWHLRFRSNSVPPHFIVLSNGKSFSGKYNSIYYRVLYNSSTISIWAQPNICNNVPLNLSLGFQDSLLNHARMITNRVIENQMPEDIFFTSVSKSIDTKKHRIPTEVFVSIWKDGYLRGSMKGEGDTIFKAIENAVTVVLKNERRFKPISKKELINSRIEVTVISGLKVNVSNEVSLPIDYTKGYLLTNGEKQGWFVPEVFNALKFNNKKEFVHRLAFEKADMTEEELKNAQLYAFEVCDFIESESKSDSLQLRASMLVPKILSEKNQAKVLTKTTLLSLEWINSVLDEDGYLKTITPVYTQGMLLIDWSRLAFLAYALSELRCRYGKKLPRCNVDIMLDYCGLHITGKIKDGHNTNSNLYGVTYLAHAYLSMGLHSDAAILTDYVVKVLSKYTFEPILFLETLSLLSRWTEVGKKNETYKSLHTYIFEKCVREFEIQKKQKSTNTASWAEAVHSFLLSNNKELSFEVADWLVSHQKDDGSFMESRSSEYGYTRGTSKIFEVLALYPDKYKKNIVKTIEWLCSMQYDDNNMFFVNPKVRPFIKGGFRHDYGNPDVWSDSTAHFLLGASRLSM